MATALRQLLGAGTAPISTHDPGLRVAAAILLIVAICARWRVFGDPVIHIDEQFYWLVGGRMLHGDLPYVDIWDRKPIGLFLLYALFHLLGRGVIAYQIGALLSVWATALLLFAMGRRIAPPVGALAGAILYILYLDLAGGEGGQAPVFYNLPVAAAIALIFFQRHRVEAKEGDLRWIGAGAMLLFGVALQIKYSALFEGLFAGIALLWRAWRGGRPPGALVGDALIWIGCALAPTLAAAGFYAMIGHGRDWWFANATSILQRGSEQPDSIRTRIAVMAGLMVPLVLCVPLRRWTGSRPVDPAARDDLRFLDGWAASALLGVVLFGSWFNHYALPLFSPFALVAAPLWNGKAGRAWLVTMLVVIAAWGQHMLWRHGITRGTAKTLDAAVEATRGFRGCLFVYDGMPALYDAAGSCLPTTHPFPSHLQSLNESGATGVDGAAEVRRIMVGRPDRVMTMEPAYDEENLAARAELYRALSPDYRLLYRYTGSAHEFAVYGLRATTAGMAVRVDRPDTRFF